MMIKKLLIRGSIYVLLILSILYVMQIIYKKPKPSPMQINIVSEPGLYINKALANYKEDHGSFAASLDCLVPGYIKKLPNVRCGTGRWEYMASESKTNYILFVRYSSESMRAVGYIHQSGDWSLIEAPER